MNNNQYRFLVPVILLVLSYGIKLLLSPSSSEVERLNYMKNFINNDLETIVPVTLRFADEGFNFPDLALAVQIQTDYELPKLTNEKLKVEVIDKLIPLNETTNSTSDFNEGATGSHLIELCFSTENAIGLDPMSEKVYVFYDISAIGSNDLPFYVTQAILYHLADPYIKLANRNKSEDEKALEDEYTRSLKLNFILADENPGNNTEINDFFDQILHNYVKEVSSYVNISFDSTSTMPEDLIDAVDLNNSTGSTMNIFLTHRSKKNLLPRGLGANVDTLIYDNQKSLDILLQDKENIGQMIINLVEKKLGFPESDINPSLKVAAMERHQTIISFIKLIDDLIYCLKLRNEKNIRLFDSKLDDIFNSSSNLFERLKSTDTRELGANLAEITDLYSSIQDIKYQLNVF